ncbi:MAG TPA: rhodanese-like domain-containing protein [Candidatus Kapabacteria bacterium]|nr:rhodanese-like domain-containing protein [Candidatus Kapabacteria bacterium]
MFGFRSATRNGYGRIGLAELEAMREGGTAPYLLDVREAFELTAFGKIPGVVNIPLGQLRQRGNELPADRDRAIVAVCQSGARSRQAAATLVDLGYRNVYSLDGGTLGWMKAGR